MHAITFLSSHWQTCEGLPSAHTQVLSVSAHTHVRKLTRGVTDAWAAQARLAGALSRIRGSAPYPGVPVRARWPHSGSLSQPSITTGDVASTVYSPAQPVMFVSSRNCIGARWLSSLKLRSKQHTQCYARVAQASHVLLEG